MLWTPLQQHNPWLFHQKIDPESAPFKKHHEFCGNSRIYSGIRAFIVAIALAAVLTQAPESPAQTLAPPPEARELIIGTKVAPPFAMKGEDGTWRGISIDLWRHVADQIHLRYRFQETTLKGLTDGVATGSLDAAVAAVTVTGPRQ
ncbi:MAG: transporter substrate-binding domain-containing protein, partial [Verrucomicrobia bacterium]|nr:transporter substrate-binding domain-containing protein [Verrucomicrobiota bacterium]